MDGLVNSLSELSLVFYVSASMLVQAEARSCWNFLSHNPRMHAASLTQDAVIPKIELVSDEENITVSMVIPEFTAEDLRLKITDQYLDVKGHKKTKRGADSKSFQRTLTFSSDVLSEMADAQFSNGVLTVTVPVASESRKKCLASILPVH